MSNVDNYVLLPHLNDEDKFNELNGHLGVHKFGNVDDDAGGGKRLEMPVWVTATNYVPIKDVVEAILKVKWSVPEALVLMHCDQAHYEWVRVEIFDHTHKEEVE